MIRRSLSIILQNVTLITARNSINLASVTHKYLKMLKVVTESVTTFCLQKTY